MKIHLRAVLMGAATVAATGITACGNGPPEGSGGGGGGGACGVGSSAVSGLGTAAVSIQATDNQTFSPASQTAKVGQVVEWTAGSSLPHTITFNASNASCLDDAQINPGSTWQIKFTQPGTYSYICTIHPGMQGTITVTG